MRPHLDNATIWKTKFGRETSLFTILTTSSFTLLFMQFSIKWTS
jgi:hypothetical protein